MVLHFSLLAGLAIIHFMGSSLRFLHGVPRSIWLSAAGGASVAYIFLHLIPELVEYSKNFTLFDHELSIFIIALAGLCFIYGLEKLAGEHHKEQTEEVFWVHISSYSIYNFIIGYLLIDEPERGWIPLLLFFLAMGLHFLVSDYGMLSHHKKRYLKTGRWILAAAVLAGGVIAAITNVSSSIVYGLMAFISGGIIMNVMKEELPENRKSRYWAFILGAAGYSILLFFLIEAGQHE